MKDIVKIVIAILVIVIVWKIVKGLGVMARAIGLVGHILEETRDPMATEIWDRVEEEATRHLRK